MDFILEIDLADRGGLLRFRSHDLTIKWIDAELSKWGWLTTENFTDRFDLGHQVNERFRWLRDRITESQNQLDQGADVLGNHFRTVFNSNPRVLLSEGELGRRVLDILEGEGPEAAAAAYFIGSGRGHIQHTNSLPELTGAILIAAPGAQATKAIATRLSSERRNLKDRAERLVDMLEAQAEKRQLEFQSDRRRGRELASLWVRRRFARWQAAFDKAVSEDGIRNQTFHDESTRISGELAATRTTYEEALRLKAPATYWKDKAATHLTAENSARNKLYLFFPLALVAIMVAFGFTGFGLLSNPPPANSTALYFIVSGGLATFAGVIFWVGRLLVIAHGVGPRLRDQATAKVPPMRSRMASRAGFPLRRAVPVMERYPAWI